MRGRGRGRGRPRNACHHPAAAAAAAAAAYMYDAGFPPIPPPFLPHLMPVPMRRPRGRGRGHRGSFYRYHGNSGNFILVQKEHAACKYYARGRCTNGHACRYTHEHRAVCAAYTSGNDECQGYEDGETGCNEGTHELNEFNAPECERYLGGICHLGTQCPLRHTDSPENTACKYFAQAGVCMNGRQCLWLHTEYCREIEDAKGCSKSKCPLKHASLYARIHSQQALWKHHLNLARQKDENGKKNEDTLAQDTDAYIDRNGDPGLADNGHGGENKQYQYQESGRVDDGYLSLHVENDNEEEEEEEKEKEKANGDHEERRAVVVKKEEDEEVIFVKENLAVSRTNSIQQTPIANDKDESEGEIAECSEGEIDAPIPRVSSSCLF